MVIIQTYLTWLTLKTPKIIILKFPTELSSIHRLHRHSRRIKNKSQLVREQRTNIFAPHVKIYGFDGMTKLNREKRLFTTTSLPFFRGGCVCVSFHPCQFYFSFIFMVLLHFFLCCFCAHFPSPLSLACDDVFCL